MSINQITLERFSLTCAKTFDEVLSSIESQVGHPDIAQFMKGVASAKTDEELQEIVRKAVGPTDLMEFTRFDQGAVLRKEDDNAPRVLRLLIGNPLTMRKMVKHVHDAGSYAPVTILIDERLDGV